MKRFGFYIASRYTLSPGKSYLLAFISRVSIIGLVLAVSVLITVLSVMNGFDRALKEHILALIPHATLSGDYPVENWREMLEVTQDVDGIAHAEPFSFLQTLAIQGSKVQSTWLYGIDPDFQQSQGAVAQLVGLAQLKQLQQDKTLILGKGLADKLAVQQGDVLRLVVPASDMQAIPAADYFTVLQVIHTGTELDQKLALTHRRNFAQLMQRPIDSVDGLRIQVDDLFHARWIANQLAQVTGLYRVHDWSRSHGNLYQAIQMSRKMVVLLVLIIIAVAAFNIVSTLVLAVKDKAGDIAILRTMGANNRQILTIFIWQGLMIGLIGVVVGVALGVLFSWFVGDLVKGLEALFNVQFLDSSVYPVDHLPSQVKWQDIFVVSSSALLLSVLASLFPAWQASRLEPATILRYE